MDFPILRKFGLKSVKHINPNHQRVDGVITVRPSFPKTEVEVDLGVGTDCHGERLAIQWTGVNPDQIILALDVDRADEALSWVRRLHTRVGTFKVGLQLYLSSGFEVMKGLQKLGVPVFLDLKFHDIPNTVAHAVAATTCWRPRFLTVHTSGGREMMEAAAGSAAPETRVLGVTVLTSLSEKAAREVGWNAGIGQTVCGLSLLAKEAGLAGIVCSPHEAERERAAWGSEAEVVTPGVRPAGVAGNDQARSRTPQEAIRDGASRVVVGRPVLQAANPEEVLDKILSGHP